MTHAALLQTGWGVCHGSRKSSLPAVQAYQREAEAMLQKRLDEVSDELRKTQSSYKSLLADAEKTKVQQQSVAGEELGSAWGGL